MNRQPSRVPIGESDAMARVRETVARIGPSELPVLITGESGTGKEVIARAIHAQSRRQSKKLVVVDCAAITPTLMESELFGHIKGSFTGASSTTTGMAAAADGGTLFLDEIGEIPPSVQVKLLRLLEDGSYRSVGDTRTRRVDLRVLAATNRDLETAMSRGDFRPDLYHRLNGVRIHLPPLRERPQDILPLAHHFIETLGRPTLRLSPEAESMIVHSVWAGNVRELLNCIRFITSLVEGDVVGTADLPAKVRSGAGDGSPYPSQTEAEAIDLRMPYKEAKRAWLDRFEDAYVTALLEQHGGNVSAAAAQAGMDRRSIQRILKRRRERD